MSKSILTRKPGLILPSRLKQRGSIGHFSTPMGIQGVVSLTDALANDVSIGGGAQIATSGFRFNADGTIDSLEGAIYTQINVSTDWVIPNAGGKRLYYLEAQEFSYVENETNPVLFGTRNGTMATWLPLGGGGGFSQEWSLDTQSNTAGAGDISWVVDFEIATDALGSNVVATGRMTMTGEVG